MYSDIIPITYKAGSGGNFLCHFLVSAKIKNKELIKLSPYGHAHHSLSDLYSSRTWINQTDKFIIDSLSKLIKKQSIAPYFVSAHLTDIDLINLSFNKSIRIVYDIDDAEEIATIFYKKFVGNNSNNIKQFISESTLENEISYTKNDWQYFNNEINIPNILFVSWKEYFRGDIEDLITKLSLFTDINSANFSRESLILWRTATEKCLD